MWTSISLIFALIKLIILRVNEKITMRKRDNRKTDVSRFREGSNKERKNGQFKSNFCALYQPSHIMTAHAQIIWRVYYLCESSHARTNASAVPNTVQYIDRVNDSGEREREQLRVYIYLYSFPNK